MSDIRLFRVDNGKRTSSPDPPSIEKACDRGDGLPAFTVEVRKSATPAADRRGGSVEGGPCEPHGTTYGRTCSSR